MTVDLTDADNFTSLIRFLSFKMVEIVDCESPNSRAMAMTGLPPSCWAIILSFISRVIAFFLLFSPEAGDRWAFCRHDWMRKHKTQYPKNAAATQYTVQYRLITSWSCGWLGAAAAAQHRERVSYHTSLAREKIKIQNLKYGFYWMRIAFAPS